MASRSAGARVFRLRPKGSCWVSRRVSPIFILDTSFARAGVVTFCCTSGNDDP